MSNLERYRIAAGSLTNVEKEVSKLLDKGFELMGGIHPVLAPNLIGGGQGVMYCQAVYQPADQSQLDRLKKITVRPYGRREVSVSEILSIIDDKRLQLHFEGLGEDLAQEGLLKL